MPEYLNDHLSAEEREEFLQEASIIPPNQEKRLILGYAEARTKLLQEAAMNYVWPWWHVPSPNPQPDPPGDWPNLKNINTDWLSGEFEGIDSAPARTKIEQDNYLELLQRRNYRFCKVDAASWNPNPTEVYPHGVITPYDGLSNPHELFPWLAILLAHKIVPIINIGTEGSPESWALRQTNEWYWAHIKSVAKQFYNFCAGQVIFLYGYEVDKEERAEWWGWRGMSITSKEMKEGCDAPIYMHLLNESIGPIFPEDNPWGYEWEQYWTEVAAFDGLFLQYKRVEHGEEPDYHYFASTSKRISKKFHDIGKRVYADEFTRMGFNEETARQVGKFCVLNNMDGSGNGIAA